MAGVDLSNFDLEALLLDLYAEATPKPTYPETHQAGMRVPKGGSSCASCEYLADNKTDCTSEHFQKWHGSPTIPGPIDEYCSDWYEESKAIEAQALFNDIQIEGFTSPEEEFIRAALSRVPPELTVGVEKIIADRGMGAKHGNYDEKTKEIRLNPNNLRLRVRLGKGQGWMLHAETTMVHEIGHSVYEGLTEEQQNEWMAISGWRKSETDGDATYAERYIERRPGWPPYRSKWIHKKQVQFTRHYAEKNPDEDFADSFSFFILGKPFQMSPKKRRFLEALVKEKVQKYPSALISGPTKAYVDAAEEVVEGAVVEALVDNLLAGGPGSGCNPAVAQPRCGRPEKDRSLHRGSVTGLFVRNSDAHKLYEILKDGKTVKKKEIRALLGKQAINSTLAAMAKRVQDRGWKLEITGQNVRLIKQPPKDIVKVQDPGSSPSEEHLANTPIGDSKPLGGGMNPSMLVKFEDGSKGVFKPDVDSGEVIRRNITPGMNTEREVAAWQVAKLVGMEDMVAPSVIREYKGERGVLLGWQEGEVADAVPGAAKYDGTSSAARAAVFDWVIGNEDRHSGNWILGNDKKLKLIDHGLSFPDKKPYRGSNDYILSHARMELPDNILTSLAAPYVAAEGKIALALSRLGLPEGAMHYVSERIAILSEAKSWKKLRGFG